MLVELKKHWRTFRDARPGKRFEMLHDARSDSPPPIVFYAAGAVLLAGGVVLLFIPGPGLLLIAFGAALAELLRYRFGHVANPTFRKVKANDADRVPVLAFQQIVDDRFKIGVFNVCLAPSTTQAEVVEDQIDIPVDAGNNRL